MPVAFCTSCQVCSASASRMALSRRAHSVSRFWSCCRSWLWRSAAVRSNSLMPATICDIVPSVVTVIRNQAPSSDVRGRLAAEGRPVLVSFSAGKDSIATELALRDAGVDTVLVYLWLVPGLRFVDDGLARLEDELGKPVHRFPHPSFYRWLNNFVFQPPERCAVIESFGLPSPSFDQMWTVVREELGLPPDTWVADGVRAADSIVRRASFVRYGLMKPRSWKCSPIADWLVGEVRECIASHGVSLPIDYEWFGRSFDGLDYRFLGPLAKNAPADFRRILEWFPLAELELARHEMMDAVR